MNILIISTNEVSPWGGSEEFWFEAALYYRVKGHNITVYKKDWGIRKSLKINELHLNKITVIDLSKLESDLKKLFFRVKYDVALVNRGMFLEGISVIEKLINCNLPVISITHVVSDLFQFDDLKWDRLKTISKKLLINGFVSNYNSKLFKKILLDDNINTKVLINPIDHTSSEYVEYPQSAVPTFAIVSRLDRFHKGLDLILETFFYLKDEMTFKVNIYGDGHNKRYLQEAVDYFKLKDQISLHNFISDKKVIWKENQALLMLSRLEGLPLSMTEALSVGRIVIANEQSAIDDIIEIDERLAYKLNSCNPSEISKEIASIISDTYHDWQELGIKSHNIFTNLLSMSNYYKQLDTILESV